MDNLITYDTALERLLDHAETLGQVRVNIADCVGRVLADDLVATCDKPPYDASAMDGYAVQYRDLATLPAKFKLIGEVAAGAHFSGRVNTHEAVRIFTGGRVPAGADKIIIQEDARKLDRMLLVSNPTSTQAHIRKAGSDFSKGNVLLSKGRALQPMDTALIAATDRADIDVYRRPRVHVFSTGNELIMPGESRHSHSHDLSDSTNKIINSNSFSIEALVSRFGGIPSFGGILSDDKASIERAVTEAGQVSDLIITLGGASVGDYDLIRPTLRDLGAEFIFEKIAVKPGKPTWFARLANETLVLGLPGNPASALVCAHLCLGPLLRTMTGHKDPKPQFVTAIADAPLAAGGSRETYMRGFAHILGGRYRVSSHALQDSSFLRPFIDGNVLIRRAINEPRLDIGDLVDVLPLEV